MGFALTLGGDEATPRANLSDVDGNTAVSPPYRCAGCAWMVVVPALPPLESTKGQERNKGAEMVHIRACIHAAPHSVCVATPYT
eukprot:m.289043 g.289043  ORF g.289043 m.289043 type:complete len:84 (+) comp27102_c0_seq2:106-357(+)